MKQNSVAAALLVFEKEIAQMEWECRVLFMSPEKLLEKQMRIERLKNCHRAFSRFENPDLLLNLEQRSLKTLALDEQLTGIHIFLTIRHGEENFTKIEEDYRK